MVNDNGGTEVSYLVVFASVLSREFTKIAQLEGLKRVSFHDLGRTFVSFMFSREAKPEIISKVLGHNSIAFTMDI